MKWIAIPRFPLYCFPVRASPCDSAFWAHDVQDAAIYTSFSFDCRVPVSGALPLMKQI
jgi:hypothetical protein